MTLNVRSYIRFRTHTIFIFTLFLKFSIILIIGIDIHYKHFDNNVHCTTADKNINISFCLVKLNKNYILSIKINVAKSIITH